jgi:hypothetical protein
VARRPWWRFSPAARTTRRSALPDDSLCIVDREFLAATCLLAIEDAGKNRHWMTRAKSTTRWRTVKRLGKGDELVELEFSESSRRRVPGIPERWLVRAIRYERKGFKPQTVLTSLTDHKQFPARELVALYHERWELELGFDEVKTELLEREEALRSKTPPGVAQELWSLGLLYNLVRLEMEQIAAEARVPPTRISFIASLQFIQNCWLPIHLAVQTQQAVLPARREDQDESLPEEALQAGTARLEESLSDNGKMNGIAARPGSRVH